MKQTLLAVLLVLIGTPSLHAGNIWPHATSSPVSSMLSKLSAKTGIDLSHVVVPKLPAAVSSHSFDWSHHFPGDSSSPEDCLPSLPTHHWPTGTLPSPWTPSWHGGGGFPSWGFPDEKIEQKYEDKFDTLSNDLDDLIATVPDYADTDDYQDLVDDIEKLIDRHGDFVDRVDAKIEHITNAIDRTDDTIEHLNKLLDRLESNSHIPAKALEQIEKQIQRAESRVEDRLAALEAKKTALEDKLAEYGLFQSQIEDYLHDVQNPTSPLTASTLAAEPVANSLAFSLNESAAKASQAFSDASQQSAASNTSNPFQADAAQTATNSESSTQNTDGGSSQSDPSSTLSSLAALQPTTLDSVTPNSKEGEVEFNAGVNVSETVGGGTAEYGGVNATFESQAGGTFSSDYFQSSNEQSLIQAIGQTAFDKINFLLSDDLQGWELHFEGDFDGSASIVLGYDESILPVGLDESKLQIMHFNSAKGFWELPEGFMVDTIANQFRFSVDGFSPFVMTFNAETSANPEPSTGVIFTLGLLMMACKRRRSPK